MTRYWIRISGAECGPYYDHEIVARFGASLPSNTPCARVGENEWSTLQNILPGIGTADPSPEPSPEPTSAVAEMMIEGVLHKLIGYPILIVTALVCWPLSRLYDKTDNLLWGALMFIVGIGGIAAYVLVPRYVANRENLITPKLLFHSLPLIGPFFSRLANRAKKTNPFITER